MEYLQWAHELGRRFGQQPTDAKEQTMDNIELAPQYVAHSVDGAVSLADIGAIANAGASWPGNEHPLVMVTERATGEIVAWINPETGYVEGETDEFNVLLQDAATSQPTAEQPSDELRFEQASIYYSEDLHPELAEDLRDCGAQGDATVACRHFIARWQPRFDSRFLRRHLRAYGWDSSELADDGANLERTVWLAGCQLRESNEFYVGI